jgi:hypothetical protein
MFMILQLEDSWKKINHMTAINIQELNFLMIRLIWFQIFLKNEMLCIMWFDKIKSSQSTFQKKKKYLQ